MRKGEASALGVVRYVLALLLMAGCGGGGGDTTQPPNNTPASVTLSQTGTLGLTSGTTATITATVLTSDGRTLSGVTVSWASTDQTVATVQNGLITAVKVGSATITASTAGVTSPGLTVSVTPGAVAALSIRTQPTGAVVAVPLTTPPVIELRDAAGNLATNATAPVSVVIASGGGTLDGTTIATASAGLATFGGFSIIGLVGDRTLRFSSGTLSTVTSASFTLSVGAPVALGLRTQPGGAAVAAALTAQPVVEIQDAGTNLVTSSAGIVRASIASGGGVLGGIVNVNTTGGVAAFSDLTMTGLVGPRTLLFDSPGLSSITSASFALAPGAPAQMAFAAQPVGGAVGALLLTAPVIELRDVSGNLSTGATTPVTATVTFGGGLVIGGTVTPTNGVAAFPNLIVTGSVGDRELTFSATGVPSVTSSRFRLVAVLYGTTSQKIQIIDVGGTSNPTQSAATQPAFASRASTRATVDNTGRITGQSEGQAWVVSSVAGGADSVLAIVPRAPGGPVLRTNRTDIYTTTGTATSVDLVLDPRATPVTSVNLFLTFFYENQQQFPWTVNVLGVAGVSVVAAQPTLGVIRISIASTTPINAPITFARLSYTAGAPGSTLFVNLTAIDAFALDGTDLLPVFTSTIYPVIPR